jgi:hypothetical protein
LEAVITRMKVRMCPSNQQDSDYSNMSTGIQSFLTSVTLQTIRSSANHTLRFVAVSATIPNAADLAEWLGNDEVPAAAFT